MYMYSYIYIERERERERYSLDYYKGTGKILYSYIVTQFIVSHYVFVLVGPHLIKKNKTKHIYIYIHISN